MGFDRYLAVRKNLFLECHYSREPIVSFSQGFSIFSHEYLLRITYFVKPPIDLLLTFNSVKED